MILFKKAMSCFFFCIQLHHIQRFFKGDTYPLSLAYSILPETIMQTKFFAVFYIFKITFSGTEFINKIFETLYLKKEKELEAKAKKIAHKK